MVAYKMYKFKFVKAYTRPIKFQFKFNDPRPTTTHLKQSKKISLLAYALHNNIYKLTRFCKTEVSWRQKLSDDFGWTGHKT